MSAPVPGGRPGRPRRDLADFRGQPEEPPIDADAQPTPPRRHAGRDDLLPTAPPVTQLTDRSVFTGVLDGILADALRRRRSIALVMLEITRAGRSLFVERLAQDLARVVRTSDRMWRIGPRTLVIVLADVDVAETAAAVGRLRVWMANQAMVPLSMAWSAAPPGIDGAALLHLLDEEIHGPGETGAGEHDDGDAG